MSVVTANNTFRNGLCDETGLRVYGLQCFSSSLIFEERRVLIQMAIFLWVNRCPPRKAVAQNIV